MGRDDKTIMSVDGSATLRYYYGILLKRLAFTVIAAESAEETLSIIKDSIPSLMLADRAVLESAGADFFKKVKDCNPMEPVRVIVFADREDASARSGFLIKHQEPRRLYQSIQTALEPKPRDISDSISPSRSPWATGPWPCRAVWRRRRCLIAVFLCLFNTSSFPQSPSFRQCYNFIEIGFFDVLGAKHAL